MGKTLFSVLGIVAGLSLASTAVSENYYRWVDDDNVTHYSKHPPRDRESTAVQTIGTRSAPAPAPASPADNATSSDTQDPQQLSQNKVEKDPAVCAQARANLQTMQEHARIRQRDEYGEERLLSEEEKAKEIQRARDAIKTHCQ